MNRPKNIKKLPVRELPAPNHRQRTALYNLGEDPDISPEKYEMFYQAFCLCGGSVAEAYAVTKRAWNEERSGPIPSLEQLEGYARSQDWRHRFLETMLDPAQASAFSQLADAALRGLELASVETVRDVTLGQAGPPKEAALKLRGAQTALLLIRSTRIHRRNDDEAPLARTIGDGTTSDLTPEEIARRTADDWQRERPASTRTPRPVPASFAGTRDPNDETDNSEAGDDG